MTMIISAPGTEPSLLRQRLRAHYRADETGIVEMLLGPADVPAETQDRIAARARTLVVKARSSRRSSSTGRRPMADSTLRQTLDLRRTADPR
jgi:hypothetical protein